PLADAVSFVDREQRYHLTFQELDRPVLNKPFRRHVQQFDSAAQNLLGDATSLTVRQRTVDERRRNAAGLQRIDLILHQRNQRRDDNRQSWQNHRGSLITPRLPAARRHHHQRASPVDRTLPRPP